MFKQQQQQTPLTQKGFVCQQKKQMLKQTDEGGTRESKTWCQFKDPGGKWSKTDPRYNMVSYSIYLIGLVGVFLLVVKLIVYHCLCLHDPLQLWLEAKNILLNSAVLILSSILLQQKYNIVLYKIGTC